MADSKVSGLASNVAITANDLINLIQGLNSKKIPISSLIGLTLIAESLLGADTGVITFNNIPQIPWRHLILRAYARHVEAVTDNYLRIRFNNDSGNNYDYQHQFIQNATTSFSGSVTQPGIIIGDFPGASSTRATQIGGSETYIPNYAQSTFEKCAISRAGCSFSAAASGVNAVHDMGFWRNVAAITRIDIFQTNGANIKAGSLFSLYGSM
jgi:hypothetical protein